MKLDTERIMVGDRTCRLSLRLLKLKSKVGDDESAFVALEVVFVGLEAVFVEIEVVFVTVELTVAYDKSLLVERFELA
jgi:hypothetical protein